MNKIINYYINFMVISIIILILLVLSSVIFTSSSQANNYRSHGRTSLVGTSYSTPSGTTIDVVTIPGFGKCLITPGGPICK